MVSSKCCQVESPSPLRFFAALIPPCAHTECERLTGTIENRPTLPPISAILITAARPASPPPMTIIFGAAAISIHRPSVVLDPGPRIDDVPACVRLLEARPEGVQARKPNYAQQEEERHAQPQESSLGLVTRDDAPLC